MNTHELDKFVNDHLDLQVKISYKDHHDFLIRHGLENCLNVLDIGCGNGTFVSKLSWDHKDIQFVGLDKRQKCIENSAKYSSSNLEFYHVDMFSQKSNFNFKIFDGFLMRYFLLHVDNAKKMLDFIKRSTKDFSKIWIIDLDWSSFRCIPTNPTFDKMTELVKDFCQKISMESQGGQNVLPILEELGFKNIKVENIPFTNEKIPQNDFALYLKQEMRCYSMMSARKMKDEEFLEIMRFIDEDVKIGRYQVSYGMILISAEIN